MLPDLAFVEFRKCFAHIIDSAVAIEVVDDHAIARVKPAGLFEATAVVRVKQHRLAEVRQTDAFTWVQRQNQRVDIGALLIARNHIVQARVLVERGVSQSLGL